MKKSPAEARPARSPNECYRPGASGCGAVPLGFAGSAGARSPRPIVVSGAVPAVRWSPIMVYAKAATTTTARTTRTGTVQAGLSSTRRVPYGSRSSSRGSLIGVPLLLAVSVNANAPEGVEFRVAMFRCAVADQWRVAGVGSDCARLVPYQTNGGGLRRRARHYRSSGRSDRLIRVTTGSHARFSSCG
jgi:hypothetical protein